MKLPANYENLVIIAQGDLYAEYLVNFLVFGAPHLHPCTDKGEICTSTPNFIPIGVGEK